MVYFSESFQSFDFVDGLQQDGLLFQKFIHLLVLVFPQLLRSFVSVGVVYLLLKVLLEASQLCYLLAQTLEFFVYVNVCSQL